MATLTMPDVVNEIISGNGRYEGDPQVVKIVEYKNDFTGAKAWGVVYHGDGNPMRYEMSASCHDPKVIWRLGEPTTVRVSR